jgi:hypothetical protein
LGKHATALKQDIARLKKLIAEDRNGTGDNFDELSLCVPAVIEANDNPLKIFGNV